MKYLIALVGVCLIGFACTDEPEREAAPTGPSAAVVPAASVARIHTSTVCLAYAGEEARLEEALTKAPADARLKGQHAAIEAAIKDACS